MDVGTGIGNAGGMARGLFPLRVVGENSVVPKVGASDMRAASLRLDGPAELGPEVVLVRAQWASYTRYLYTSSYGGGPRKAKMGRL